MNSTEVRRTFASARILAALADRRGVSAVEFALILPLMVMIYLGGVEVTRALDANRKLTELTRTIADIVAKSEQISATDLSHVVGLAAPLLAPNEAAPATIRIFAVWTDANLKSSVDWSFAKSGSGSTAPSALAPGSAYVLPDGLESASRQTIVAAIDYTVQPAFGAALTGPIPLSQIVYQAPRSGKCVRRTDASGQSCAR